MYDVQWGKTAIDHASESRCDIELKSAVINAITNANETRTNKVNNMQ